MSELDANSWIHFSQLSKSILQQQILFILKLFLSSEIQNVQTKSIITMEWNMSTQC